MKNLKNIKEGAVIFKNKRGENLWGVLSYPKTKKKIPGIIFAHGFFSTKSSRKYVKMARILACKGFGVLRFDFAGCGDSEGDFQKTSIRKQIEDLESALNFLLKNQWIDKKRIGLLGHSLGGLIVLLFQLKKEVAKTMVLLAPALNQKELIKIWYQSCQLKKWREKGYLDLSKGRIGIDYLKEVQNKDYTPLLSQLKIPCLILHGQKDDDIPLKFSKEAYQYLKKEKKLVVIKEAEHHFEGFDALKKMIKNVVFWFEKYLK